MPPEQPDTNHPLPEALLTFDPVYGAAPVPSPCIGLCQMEPDTGLCQGCQRDIDEIVAWGGTSDASKRVIWHAINQRRANA
jgi:predicted Fe-S protein YdhL (DUF1289 family)